MCDFSLHHVKSRPAKVGDKLTTRNFNTGRTVSPSRNPGATTRGTSKPAKHQRCVRTSRA